MRADDAIHQAAGQAVADRLQSLRLGEQVTVRNLCMVPLLDGTGDAPGYLTLDEAIAQGLVQITELSEGGSVPELKLTNAASQPVLLLDGEELVGAKQNRVLNLTILVPAGATTVIPVSCVEAGRWAYRSERFAASPRVHYAAGRAQRMEQVSASLRREGRRRSDQGQVWAHISARMADLGADSPTEAMADIYEHHAATIEEYASGMRLAEGQVGGVFLVGDALLGCELFDHPATMAHLFGKLVRSYALDALALRAGSVPDDVVEAASALLRDAGTARTEAFEAIGLGVDLRLTGERLTGAALVAEGRVVHLSLFRTRPPRETAGAGARLQRPSERLWRARRGRGGE